MAKISTKTSNLKSIADRIVVSPSTEVVAGEGHIVTAGSIDSHIHFICPQQIESLEYMLLLSLIMK